MKENKGYIFLIFLVCLFCSCKFNKPSSPLLEIHFKQGIVKIMNSFIKMDNAGTAPLRP